MLMEDHMQMGKSIGVCLCHKQIAERRLGIFADAFEKLGHVRKYLHAQVSVSFGFCRRLPARERSPLIVELGAIKIPYTVLGPDRESAEPIAMS